jgi:hypothetical protein
VIRYHCDTEPLMVKHPKGEWVKYEDLPFWLLNGIAEYLEGHSDIKDGSYGEPTPNSAMSLLLQLERYLPPKEKRFGNQRRD